MSIRSFSKKEASFFRGHFIALFKIGLLVSIVIIPSTAIYISYVSRTFTPEKVLNYQPALTTKILDKNGLLISEYAKERRIFVPIDKIPKSIIDTFIAVEDKTFFTNSGVDFIGILRMIFVNINNVIVGKRFQGASTITQQVVRNIILSRERTVTRKIKEIIYSWKISKIMSKQQILELYLNHIYLGSGAYGIEAAAQEFFDKSINALSIQEIAMLAALPKAPSSLDPRKHPKAAEQRRNYVLRRLLEDSLISEGEYIKSIESKMNVSQKKNMKNLAFAFSDIVKDKVTSDLEISEDDFLSKGFTIQSTLDVHLQKTAVNALHEGILRHDRKHGYVGPIKRIMNVDHWLDELKNVEKTYKTPPFVYAVVIKEYKNKVEIGLEDGSVGQIVLEDMSIASKKRMNDMQFVDVQLTKASDVLTIGDVIVVRKKPDEKLSYTLEQVPDVDGAVVIMDVKTGNVMAMVGGYNEIPGGFNRVIQANRQAGSVIKPFIYLTALERGLTPSHILMDSEVTFSTGRTGEMWAPQNHTKKYLGPVTLRSALQKSINIPTIRLAEEVGISNIIEMIKSFGINQNPEPNLSTALGSCETTLLDITSAYATIGNLGQAVKPKYFSLIKNSVNETIKKAVSLDEKINTIDNQSEVTVESIITEDEKHHSTNKDKSGIVSPESAYQMISILKNAARFSGIKKYMPNESDEIFGKTGTTNDAFDTWFVGGTPNIVVGVFVGYDHPKTLGNEYGATVAFPIFVDIMKEIAQHYDVGEFTVPEGIKFVPVDKNTGLLATDDVDQKDIINEVFKITDKLPEKSTIEKTLFGIGEIY